MKPSMLITKGENNKHKTTFSDPTTQQKNQLYTLDTYEKGSLCVSFVTSEETLIGVLMGTS